VEEGVAIVSELRKNTLINEEHTGGDIAEAHAVVDWLRDQGVNAFYGWQGVPESPASVERARQAVEAFRALYAEAMAQLREHGDKITTQQESEA
jgi:hypothetical protein